MVSHLQGVAPARQSCPIGATGHQHRRGHQEADEHHSFTGHCGLASIWYRQFETKPLHIKSHWKLR